MEQSDENKLIEALKKGSKMAFTKLYAIYAPRIRAFSLRWTKNEITAEDITQEVFIRLWNERENIRQTNTVNSLLFTIASHLLINAFNKTINSPVFEDYVRYVDTLPSSGNHDPLEYSNFLSSIKLFIDRMPPTRAKVVKLSKLEGFNNKEIADILSLKEQTVKNQLSIGVKELRSFIKDFLSIVAAGVITSSALLEFPVLLQMYTSQS